MENFDINSFDFGSMTQALGVNPFDKNKKTQWEEDTRFYKLKRDDKDTGVAIIAFLPDSSKRTLINMNKINTTITRNGKRRFVSEWSPYSIKRPCPFNETAVRLWKEGNKEGYKLFRPQQRFVTNIKVLKDPACPENEGKIFLYEMSQRLAEKIQKAVMPSEQDLALGEERKEVFNPLRGWVFKLSVKKDSSGFYSYDDSTFIKCDKIGLQGSIYGDVSNPQALQVAGQKAVSEIKEKAYDLGEFQKPEFFKSYDELYEKLQYIAGGEYGIPELEAKDSQAQPTQEVQINDNTSNVTVEVKEAQTPQPTQPTQQAQTQPTQATPTKEVDELDALLGL